MLDACSHEVSGSDLYADPETLVLDVLDARILLGDDLGPDESEAKSEILFDIQQAQAELRTLVEDGVLTLYRAMVISPEWLGELKPDTALGTSWSYTLKGAFPYNGDRRSGHPIVVVSATVPLRGVDWARTFGLIGSGEREVRLQQDAELTLVDIRNEGGNITRPDLSGKSFRALP